MSQFCLFLHVLLFLDFSLASSFSSSHDGVLQPDPPNGHWVDTWTAMPQLTEFSNLHPSPFNQTNLVFFNSTIRQTFHVTTPSSQIRIRLSNAFGLTDLPITSMTIAIPTAPAGQNLTGSSFINATTLQQVTFSGNRSITISPGALAVSDPLAFPIETNQILSTSIYLATGQATQYITSHPGSRTSSYISSGDFTTSPNITSPFTQEVFHWYFLSALEAWQPPSYSTIALIGDSITDGRASDNNGNNRWPDLLFDRLQQEKAPLLRTIAISNQAAGGNRVLEDGLGPSAISRLDRDVLAHAGVKYALVFEGVNDIGDADATVANQTLTGDRLIQAKQQIVTRIHDRGIPVLGATITPFGCVNTTLQPYSDPLREATRVRVNGWIRENVGRRVRDERNATMLDPRFDSGDCLHPNVAGYLAMADAFPVEVFEGFRGGVSTFM
ncbi:hypothetical protein M409DRAFT_29358 [Zasmidium cellare ATCC 36951]|uniref:Uncharacterized protein n=1 Tax=Zasmidium cellare ATCC 36951 TaxID=1080233 RepID=A0A6A6C3E9_ZASCE|nr:uncharacterized protein M409DRAFT_29358 [Zasmidium cellare ATCC 36951]KAF2160269.1 hypothetical protein M409DRAFT_29358 [Zasmidium cellare ATCC 36951]